MIISWIVLGKADVPMMLNGALAGLVAITASCAFVDTWAAVLIGFISGILVFYSIRFFERKELMIQSRHYLYMVLLVYGERYRLGSLQQKN